MNDILLDEHVLPNRYIGDGVHADAFCGFGTNSCAWPTNQSASQPLRQPSSYAVGAVAMPAPFAKCFIATIHAPAASNINLFFDCTRLFVSLSRAQFNRHYNHFVSYLY